MSEENGTGGLIGLLVEKDIVPMKRTPVGIVILALFLHVSWPSLKRVRDLLEHERRMSHAAVWNRVRKFGSALASMFSHEELARVVGLRKSTNEYQVHGLVGAGLVKRNRAGKRAPLYMVKTGTEK